MKDSTWGMIASVVSHGVAVAMMGVSFFTPPQVIIAPGIEVSLVAAPLNTDAPPSIHSVFQKTVEEAVKSVATPEQTSPPVAQTIAPVSDGRVTQSGLDPTTAKSGSITQPAVPSYLENPQPEYPAAAKKRGQEGLVVLEVQVDQNGSPIAVELRKSAGFTVLDKSALKAVRAWKFKPALMGPIPVASTVQVPIRFHLD